MAQIRTGIRVEGAEKTAAIFKNARRELNKKTKEGLTKAGREAMLPAAQTAARPRFAEPYLTIKASARGAYVTTWGSRIGDRILGLLEFGGTVRGPITPTHKRDGHAPALKLPNGIVAKVNAPRHYTGKLRMTRAVQARLPQMEELILPSIMSAFDGIEHKP